MNTGEAKTMIGKSVRISGDLSGSEDLEMDGEIEGSIRLSGARLTLGSSCRVRGNITGQDVTISGRVDGDVWAPGRVALRASAIVQGNIYAGSLSIEENAAFRGQVDPSRAGEPMPERAAPAVVARPSAPPSYAPADGFGTSLPRTRELPAALAAVAAARSGAIESAEEGDSHTSAPLFAETEA